MGAAVKVRDDYHAEMLPQFARRSKDAGQVRRLLALAGVRDGMDRGEAARIGGMDRQRLRDGSMPSMPLARTGSSTAKPPGTKPKLNEERMVELARIVEAGPNIETDGVVRWRCVDLKRVIKSRFAVDVTGVTEARLLKKLNDSHISEPKIVRQLGRRSRSGEFARICQRKPSHARHDHTDGAKAYRDLGQNGDQTDGGTGLEHDAVNLSRTGAEGHKRMSAIHLVFGHPQRWLLGTHHAGQSRKQLRHACGRSAERQIRGGWDPN